MKSILYPFDIRRQHLLQDKNRTSPEDHIVEGTTFGWVIHGYKTTMHGPPKYYRGFGGPLDRSDGSGIFQKWTWPISVTLRCDLEMGVALYLMRRLSLVRYMGVALGIFCQRGLAPGKVCGYPLIYFIV